MVVRRAVDGDARDTLAGGQDRPFSRVVSCCVPLVGPDAPHYFSVTDVVGQRCWLLSVRVWFWPYVETPPGQNNFRVFTGTTPINAADQMLEWDEVLPLLSYNGRRIPWQVGDNQDAMVWTMNTLYRGESRRFGIWVYRTGEWTTYMWASFEVSEE